MTHLFLTDTVFISLKWLIIIVIWLLLAIELYHDNKRVGKYHDSVAARLLHMLHKRNMQIYGLVSMLLIIMLADDIKYEVHRPVEEVREKALPAASAGRVAASALSASKYKAPQSSRIPFSDITEFNEANGRQQAYLDLLKQRYETWLITYYYLQKCGKAGPQDMEIIDSSLRRELAASGADDSVEANIHTAANGSYKEMYSAIPCDAAHIASTKAGYDATMQRIESQEESVDKPQVEQAR
jgi:hypothetical protein